MSLADGLVEGVSRWMAARQTRRSFMGRVGKFAVVVAGGTTLAGLLDRQAEARVCGQSGVSPKCATFDCVGSGSVWGWCWYASPGCCLYDGLKKICDCCTYNWPNVHGYCPSGYNVRCIAESCFADPRLQTVPLTKIASTTPISASSELSAVRYPSGFATATIGDGEDHLWAAMAAPVSATATGPLLLTARAALSTVVRDELERLGVTSVRIVGPTVSAAVEAELRTFVADVERVGPAPDFATASVQVAQWVFQRAGTRRAVCVGTTGVSSNAAPMAAAFGAMKKYPVLVGADAAVALSRSDTPAVLTWMIGPEMAARAGDVPGGQPMRSSRSTSLSREIASNAVNVEGVSEFAVMVVPQGSWVLASGITRFAGLMLVHDTGDFDPDTRTWVKWHQPFLTRGYTTANSGSLDSTGIWELQSALNHFDVDLLIGVSGEGLPVISQPEDERCIGCARESPPYPSRATTGRYWTSRANPARRP
jgi:hypothetical protein